MKDKYYDIKSLIQYFLNKLGLNNINVVFVSKTLRKDEKCVGKNKIGKSIKATKYHLSVSVRTLPKYKTQKYQKLHT